MSIDIPSPIIQEPKQETIAELKSNFSSDNEKKISSAFASLKSNTELNCSEKLDTLLSYFNNESDSAIKQFPTAYNTLVSFKNSFDDKVFQQELEKHIDPILSGINKNLDKIVASGHENFVKHLYLNHILFHSITIPNHYKVIEDYFYKSHNTETTARLFQYLPRENAYRVYTDILRNFPNDWNTTFLANPFFKSQSEANFSHWGIKEMYINLLKTLTEKSDLIIKNGHEALIYESLPYPTLIDVKDNDIIAAQQELIKKFPPLPDYLFKPFEDKDKEPLRKFRELVNALPNEQKEKITNSLDGYNKIIAAFLSQNNSTAINTSNVAQLDKDSVFNLIRVLKNDKVNFGLQLATLLSLNKYSELPEDIQDIIKPKFKNQETKILPKHLEWYLCDDAEARLFESMASNAVVLVNESLLVKFSGKLSALCTKTFTNNEGYTFLEGNWYSPIDIESRQVIKDAYTKGIAKIDVDNSNWAIMRYVTNINNLSANTVLYTTKKYTESMPDQFNVNSATRETYVDNKKEDF